MPTATPRLTRYQLDRLTLIRGVYRSLIQTGRSYAAFERKETLPLVQKLAGRGEILDPMSGYGSLLTYCTETGIHSYGIELCLPLYLWQVLIAPAHSHKFLHYISAVIDARAQWPKTSKLAEAAQSWFPDDSRRMIADLLQLINSAVSGSAEQSASVEMHALALLMPFVGRLSTSVPTEIAHHTKQGGICVYREWQQDFALYLRCLAESLKERMASARECRHVINFGDSRTFAFPPSRFRAMITSPPYPNQRDLADTFAPETDVLTWLHEHGYTHMKGTGTLAIGTNTVAGRKHAPVLSTVAREFLAGVRNFKGKREQIYDNDVYYYPYFSNYFADLEMAYGNISRALSSDFEGFIIVADNNARDQTIPVAKVIIDIWQSLGFHAELADSEEVFHVGTKNPRARGHKAKHMKHIIRIWRGR